MSPQLAAGLTALVGVCMVAGWLTAFRNRAYLGLLGLGFLTISGFLLALAKARAAEELGADSSQIVLLARLLFGVCLLLFLLAAVAAIRETARRMREIRTGYREAEEAMLEMVQAAIDKERESEADSKASGTPADSEDNRE